MNGETEFINLAKAGDIAGLVGLVFHSEKSFTTSKTKLARNALLFIRQIKSIAKINDYFQSPFADYLDIDGKKTVIQVVINSKDTLLFRCFWNDYGFKDVLRDSLNDIIEYAIRAEFLDIFNELINPIKDVLTQQDKMTMLLSAVKRKYLKESFLNSFKQLEIIFPDLRYHQQDDILMKTCVDCKDYELINYLMIEREVRITKHIYLLQDDYFNHIKMKRMLSDSLKAKANNWKQKMVSVSDEKVVKI